MKCLIDPIRKKYPHPKTWSNTAPRKDTDYCVLGAYLKYMGVPDFNFPSEQEVLRVTNFDATTVDAILQANDERRFGTAWRLLEEALDHIKR